uniref:Uracil phosphoribosyltransferase n=1 Tax=Rhodomela confervoides TaxID=35163 RepID=A0A1Z1M9Z4_RHOCN|nr:uracil phosphoribosyltransferase [Rhodomela confervoides]ARW62796.1 uracil phosphoribosyltransferase [Rhodomela confervoides]
MQLNIYKISHPIIKILSTSILNGTKNSYIYENHYRYLGFLLLYEILRKYINIQEVYVKLLYSVKYFDVINSKSKYLILTDLSKTYQMIIDIKNLIPNLNIVNVNYDNPENIVNSINNVKIEYWNTDIFIIEEKTTDKKIIKLIEYLEIQKNIPLEKINICSISSNNYILNKLGNQYPKLKVYTTKIIYNNKNLNN